MKKFKLLINEVFDSNPLELKPIVKFKTIRYVGVTSKNEKFSVEFELKLLDNKEYVTLIISFFILGMASRVSDEKRTLKDSETNVIFASVISAMKDLRQNHREFYDKADYVNFTGSIYGPMIGRRKLYPRLAKNIHKIWPEFNSEPEVWNSQYGISVNIKRSSSE